MIFHHLLCNTSRRLCVRNLAIAFIYTSYLQVFAYFCIRSIVLYCSSHTRNVHHSNLRTGILLQRTSHNGRRSTLVWHRPKPPKDENKKKYSCWCRKGVLKQPLDVETVPLLFLSVPYRRHSYPFFSSGSNRSQKKRSWKVENVSCRCFLDRVSGSVFRVTFALEPLTPSSNEHVTRLPAARTRHWFRAIPGKRPARLTRKSGIDTPSRPGDVSPGNYSASPET